MQQPREGSFEARRRPATFSYCPFLAFLRRSGLSRSTKSLKIPWYQRAYIKNNQYFNIQKGSIIMGLMAVVSDYLHILALKLVTTSPFFSSYRYSPLEQVFSICTATRWLLLGAHTMAIISYRMSSFMLETCMSETFS
jgi:hypothetical protein